MTEPGEGVELSPSLAPEVGSTDTTVGGKTTALFSGLDKGRTEKLDLTQQEKMAALKAFKMADKDQSGYLDRSEMENVLEQLGIKTANEELRAKYLDRLWATADIDGSGKVDTTEFICLYGDVFAPARRFGPDIRKACCRGDVADVEILIARKCDPNLCDGTGWNCLHYAAEYGHLKVIECLEKNNPDILRANIDCVDNYGWTALMCAASNGHNEVVSKLVTSGANPNKQNDVGRTALHWAAAKGRAKMVRLLVMKCKKETLDLPDKSGWTPLFLACMNDHIEIANILIDKEAKMDIIDKCGFTVERYCNDPMLAALQQAKMRTVESPRGKKKRK